MPLFLLGFTPCKVEKPLRGLELQEKEEEKDAKDIGKLFRNSTKICLQEKREEKDAKDIGKLFRNCTKNVY